MIQRVRKRLEDAGIDHLPATVDAIAAEVALG